MSRPRFLADNDLKDAIRSGVLRRESEVEFVSLRDVGFAARSDADILEFAAANGWIIVSHDVNTMTAKAFDRLAAGESMSGLLLMHQRDPVGPTIDSLLLIWEESEAEEWMSQVCYLPL